MSAPGWVRLDTDADGGDRDRVVVYRGGQREEYQGDIVVVAAGAANSRQAAAGLGQRRHPAGLANGSDQVGRNYMYHNSKAVVALGKEPNDTVFQKTLGAQ